MVRAAVIQLSSQEDVECNLRGLRLWVGRAAAEGAEVVALPENFAFMGDESRKRAIAESVEHDASGPIVATLRAAARDARVWIVAGGMPERSDDPQRPYNTSLLVSPDGEIMAAYRKIHLFDVDLPDGTRAHESASTCEGDAVVAADVHVRAGGAFKLGMSICYDVRFPELYRSLSARGVRVVTVGAAFTLATGKDHWHVLLRARAIENQVFVLAPAQHGRHPGGRQCYGKSVIVDPWGDVIAQCPEGEGMAVASLNFDSQDRVRSSLPCLAHRRLGLPHA